MNSPFFLHLIFLCLACMRLSYCAECLMNATATFTTCAYYCFVKYGNDSITQRKYYNRFKGICEPAVTCTDTPFRGFQNRCLNPFESFLIGTTYVSMPEMYEEVQMIVIHGETNSADKSDAAMCYPGFYSSRTRIQIAFQVYQQYYCDMPIASDSYDFPRTMGQYYFNQLSNSTQAAIVSTYCATENTFDFGYSLLTIFEVLLLLCLFHFHFDRCARRAKRKIKKIIG